MDNATTKPPILIISGTNRPGSNTIRVARVIEQRYRALGSAAELYSLADMPLEAFAPGAYVQKPPAFV